MAFHLPGSPAPTLASPWPVLKAPASWRQIDFISDLHLQASESATFLAWQNYLQRTRANALFILGDLFEVWVGDDVLDAPPPAPSQGVGFELRCAQVLSAAARHLDIFFLPGNRDFLLGPMGAQACGMRLLSDPTVLDFGDERWLLSHGDALCLDDTQYMQFRDEVRSAAWQADFLQQPLAQRQDMARALRASSESRKRSGVAYADLDTPATCRWLQAAQASTLIHGHTHHPADHEMPQGLRRMVLSDWDVTATPARAEVLRLCLDTDKGYTLQRLAATQDHLL